MNYNNLLAGTGGCYRTEEQAKEDEYYLSPYGLAAGRWILCGVSGTGDVDSMISASLLLILGLSVSCFLVCAALAFTLAADWFLLILDSFYLAGVACFCVVQAIYLLRLHRWGAGLLWPLRVGLTVAALAVAALLRALEPLTAVTLCYFAELACNTVSALRLGRRGRCFGLGLLLFVGCDLCVGLHNLAAFLPVVDTGPLFSFAQVGMWLFYLPSQVLITLSVRKK